MISGSPSLLRSTDQSHKTGRYRVRRGVWSSAEPHRDCDERRAASAKTRALRTRSRTYLAVVGAAVLGLDGVLRRWPHPERSPRPGRSSEREGRPLPRLAQLPGTWVSLASRAWSASGVIPAVGHVEAASACALASDTSRMTPTCWPPAVTVTLTLPSLTTDWAGGAACANPGLPRSAALLQERRLWPSSSSCSYTLPFFLFSAGIQSCARFTTQPRRRTSTPLKSAPTLGQPTTASAPSGLP